MGEDASLLRQKRNRKPALGLEVGCGFGRSSLMKKTVNLRDSSKLDPLRFSVFFVCFANPDGAAVRTAARLCGSGGALRRGKAGDRWSSLRNAVPIPTGVPRAAGRLRSNRARIARRKRAGNLRGKFTCPFRFSDSFSYRLRQTLTSTTQVFGWVLGRSF